jgi:hypothetical protein
MRFLQQVELPKKFLLNEVLLWVAFQRVPVAMRSPEEGRETREAEEDMAAYGGYTGDLSDWGAYLQDRECAAAGLPPDPRMVALMEEAEWNTSNLEESDFEGEDARPQLETEEWRPNYEYDPDVELERAMQAWRPKYESAIEYPASRIYLALREGRLAASGKLLPDHDRDRALEILKTHDQRICDLKTLEIPRNFWSLRGIDWSSNAARNDHEHYCWIRCLTEDVLKMFPGEDREPASGVERIGENFVLNEASAGEPQPMRPRGRPPFPWDAFHLEVTDLLVRGAMPAKKEAAIQHFQEWFKKNLNVRPSRPSIGEKLKPYYDRFIKSADRN